MAKARRIALADFVPEIQHSVHHKHGHRVRHVRKFWRMMRAINLYMADPSWLGLAGIVIIVDMVIRSFIEH